ncbi:hypothetical protein HPB48_021273 [Haemaphysalis longicornis]|uniref:Uncharacterized protein n=1 Tax=Haemaphysalis longicornis TaxID=44386 RepID=A0A9J6GJ62_HAELO|nr:hypothetical protein HPB48_021273 [Haemaphysalis longicornis]
MNFFGKSAKLTKEQTPAKHTPAASPPNPYDVVVDTLAKYFATTVNVRVALHHFRERRQLSAHPPWKRYYMKPR